MAPSLVPKICAVVTYDMSGLSGGLQYGFPAFGTSCIEFSGKSVGSLVRKTLYGVVILHFQVRKIALVSLMSVWRAVTGQNFQHLGVVCDFGGCHVNQVKATVEWVCPNPFEEHQVVAPVEPEPRFVGVAAEVVGEWPVVVSFHACAPTVAAILFHCHFSSV